MSKKHASEMQVTTSPALNWCVGPIPQNLETPRVLGLAGITTQIREKIRSFTGECAPLSGKRRRRTGWSVWGSFDY